MLAIYKKEIGSFFRSMTGYLYTAFMLLAGGIFFTTFNLQGGIAEFGYVLGNIIVILQIVIPIITMRALGGEHRQGTDKLLFTVPLKMSKIVLGKFFAALTVFAVPVIILAACPLILSLYGTIPLMQSYSCFIAFLFLGAACISIGIFISSLTDNQIIAAVVTFAIMLLSYLINGIKGLIGVAAVNSLAGFSLALAVSGIVLAMMTKHTRFSFIIIAVCETILFGLYTLNNAMFEGLFPRFLECFSLFQRYYDFVDGIFDFNHLVYYLGIILLFLFFTVQSVEKKRSNTIGQYIVLMCALMTVIVVLVNLIVHQMPSKYMKLDTSTSRLYSVSRQTRDMVSALDSPVALYLIAPRGHEDNKLQQLLKKYEDLNENITVEYVDSILSPSFVKSYTSNRVSDNSIIVAGKQRSKVIRNIDFYPTSFEYYSGKTTTDFDGEGQITSAIHYVTSDTLKKIYYITGHGENELTDSFKAALKKEGIVVSTLNLTAMAEVPDDAECLFLNAPASDLAKRESKVLESYMETGGRMLLLSGINATAMPNLDRILSGYGVSAIQGMIVEGDNNYSIPSYPNLLLPIIKANDITLPLINSDGLLLLPNAHAITKLEETRNTVEINSLLMTSVNSYLKTAPSVLSYEKGDLQGPFCVGVAISEQTDYGETRIVWFSSGNLLTEDIDNMVGKNNTDLVLNSIGWMSEQENGITIRPKTIASSVLRLTSAQATSWSIVFTLVIPLLVICVGIYVSNRRQQ